MRVSYLSEIFNRKSGKTVTVLLLSLDFKKNKFDQAFGIKEFVEIFDFLYGIP